ncbi:hypothetical protein B5M45_30965 [Mycobacterium simiae]|uniref:Uncharacterized protein n=1 Tax=Mycobacterium simiae TaxID=1784 RepID=A0A1X0XI88_MYCSI|nr:hypothetical protein B5M45_30965 [Mycobacterium simiae]
MIAGAIEQSAEFIVVDHATKRRSSPEPPENIYLPIDVAILVVAGLSLVTQVLALPIVVAAVLLYAIPGVWSRFRDGKRKEAMRMHGDSSRCVVLKASAFVGSAFLTNVAAAAVPG